MIRGKVKETSHCTVRVADEIYKRGDMYFVGKSIRVLKSKTNYDFLREEVMSVGVADALENIVNLHLCAAGLYELVATNVSHDEYGQVDDWTLMLTPCKES